jgi:hypothetical protein
MIRPRAGIGLVVAGMARPGDNTLSNLRRHRPPRPGPNPRPGEEVTRFRNALEYRRERRRARADELGLVAPFASAKGAFAYGAAARRCFTG